jgi:uncharacterized protein YbjT (DUF2867 family)
VSAKILAIGANGKFAGLVIPALVARGAKVRGFVRKPESATSVYDHGAEEVVVGDLSDARSVERAFDGVESVFYIAPVALPDEVDVGKRLIALAIKVGVKRFVFSSVIHPVLSQLPNHASKAPVEEALLDSDLEYSLLHPALFYQNYAGSWDRTVKTGTLAEPWSTDTRFSRVDYRDVAEVAAIALTEQRLHYGTFELCAEGALDRHEVAALIGDVLGRPITAARVDPNTLGPDAAPLRPMFDHYDRYGLRGNALTLEAILGRAPRTLRAYFEELASQSIKQPTS